MATMLDKNGFIPATERLNLALSASVGIAGGLWWGWTFAWASLLLGLGTGMLNFRAVAWAGRRILEDRSAHLMTALFGAKLVLLMVACYVLVVLLGAEIVPLLAGLSVVYVATVIGAGRHMRGGTQAEQPEGGI